MPHDEKHRDHPNNDDARYGWQRYDLEGLDDHTVECDDLTDARQLATANARIRQRAGQTAAEAGGPPQLRPPPPTQPR